MLKRYLPILVLVLTGAIHASSVTDLSNVSHAEIRIQKSTLMTEAMQLSEAQSERFWPVYRAYDNELEKLTNERLARIKFFAENYEKMDESKADSIAREVFSLEKRRSKLREKYYKRFSKSLGNIVGVRFVQVDRQINTLVDMEIMQKVPLIATPGEDKPLPVQ